MIRFLSATLFAFTLTIASTVQSLPSGPLSVDGSQEQNSAAIAYILTAASVSADESASVSTPHDDALGVVDVVSAKCCKVCRKGKACGDSCIAKSKQCHKGPGCACDG